MIAQCAWAKTQYHNLGGLINRDLFSHSSRSWKFKIKVCLAHFPLGLFSLASRCLPSHLLHGCPSKPRCPGDLVSFLRKPSIWISICPEDII